MPRPTVEESLRPIREFTDYRVNGSAIIVNDSRRLMHTSYRQYTGTVTPDFKNLRKFKRSLPFNGFSMSKSLHFQGLMTFSAVYPQPDFLRTYTYKAQRVGYLQLGSVSRDHLGEADILASQRLAGTFNTIKTNIPLMFHERKKVADLVAKNASRLVHAALSLKKLDFHGMWRAFGVRPTRSQRRAMDRISQRYQRARHPDSARDILSSAWLEVNYGWRPLLSDIYGAAEVLSEKFRRTEGVRYAAKASGFSARTDPVFFYPAVSDLGYGEKVGEVIRGTKSQLMCFYTPNSEMKSVLAETGISNPLLTAWDAVPFSFVVDWFLPVNAYLERLTSYSGFDLSGVNRVRFTRYTLTANGSFHRSGSQYGGQWSESISVQYQETGVLYSRDTLSSPPVVPLQLRDPVSTSHATSALALLNQVFGKHFSR